MKYFLVFCNFLFLSFFSFGQVDLTYNISKSDEAIFLPNESFVEFNFYFLEKDKTATLFYLNDKELITYSGPNYLIKKERLLIDGKKYNLQFFENNSFETKKEALKKASILYENKKEFIIEHVLDTYNIYIITSNISK